MIGMKNYRIIDKFFLKVKENQFIISIIMCFLLFLSSFVFLTDREEVHGIQEDKLKESMVVETKNYASVLSTNSKSVAAFSQGAVLENLNTIKKDIDSILQVKVKGYALLVNGREIAVFEEQSEAQRLLVDIKKLYLKEDEETKIESIKFKEDVKIEETYVGINEFDKYEDALYYITKGTDEIKIHKVSKGESFWTIAKKYNIDVDDLLSANPEVKPERLQIGQEISLIVPKPFITVVTFEEKEYIEYIPFETKYEETSVLYKGEYRIKRAGKKGERKVKAKIIKENGIETNREILEETVIKEPVTKIVLKGTKNPPPRIGTGKFDKPTSRGYITSPFGWRWGRRHTGIDIGLSVGTPVKAADGGKVIFVGWKGAYGKLIIIDHGANMETYYAHLSKFVVKKGDKVFKGQTIAYSGNTGRSTGPHLHFEVRKNGNPVNPTQYVKY